MNFQIQSLARARFEHLFSQSVEALAEQNIARETVQVPQSTPCRISLQDAEVGESVLLLNYQHLPAASPFRSSHAIYVREHAENTALDINSVPEFFRHRLLSLRLFDHRHYMIDAEVVEGTELESAVEQLFEHADAEYMHLHFAKPGCFAARLERVG
ncbi:MAG: DUF1203 domain-containing protein [Gammaproteobacteria bacterium]|nr:DUF1203 domain-containing protein [Gammaproteobacteria bacterium]